MPPTKNLCAGKRAAGKVRLERLDEAAFLIRIQIMLNGLWAGVTVSALHATGCLHLLQIQHGAEGWNRLAKKGKRRYLYLPIGPRQRHRTVGGAEVDTDSAL